MKMNQVSSVTELPTFKQKHLSLIHNNILIFAIRITHIFIFNNDFIKKYNKIFYFILLMIKKK